MIDLYKIWEAIFQISFSLLRGKANIYFQRMAEFKGNFGPGCDWDLQPFATFTISKIMAVIFYTDTHHLARISENLLLIIGVLKVKRTNFLRGGQKLKNINFIWQEESVGFFILFFKLQIIDYAIQTQVCMYYLIDMPIDLSKSYSQNWSYQNECCIAKKCVWSYCTHKRSFFSIQFFICQKTEGKNSLAS